MMQGTPKPTFATYVGLFLALGVPSLMIVAGLFRLHVQVRSRLGFWLGEGAFWGLTAAVLCVLLFWERLPLSAIGLRRPTWMTLVGGIGGAIAVRLAAGLAVVAFATATGVSLERAFGHDLKFAELLGAQPFWIVILLAIRAAVTEEILFRGYGIERLAAVIGSRPVAAVVSAIMFTLAHLGAWDLTYLIIVFPVAAVLTVQYLWRRDLVANMLTHFITDAVSLIAAYAVAHHLIQVSGMSG